MLAGVIEVDDLDGAWKILLCKIPDPFSAIADYDFLFRVVPATIPGFPIETRAELGGGLDGPGVGGGIGIANRIAFPSPNLLA